MDFTSSGVFMNGTETMYLVSHGGKLFASTGVWSNALQGDPTPGPQVLRKDSATAPWVVDRSWGLEFLRVDCLQSITFTTDRHGNARNPPRTVLLASAQDVVAPRNAPVESRRRHGRVEDYGEAKKWLLAGGYAKLLGEQATFESKTPQPPSK